MRSLPGCLIALLCLTSLALGADPCTNGSFEQLDANGFPTDWGPVGEGVEVSADAHQGARAIRLVRTPDTKTVETGLNRGWKPGVGHAMIDRLRGGIDFHYKAISARSTKLMVYAIPINGQGVEKTASRRAEFAVPEDHEGDGKWHHARLKYDFTHDPEVKWVQFAARIVGSSGELLLDDLSYVERTGPILQFGKVAIEEDPAAPGDRCTLRVPLWSRGDDPAVGIQLAANLPAGLTANPATVQLTQLSPDQRAIVRIELAGRRQQQSEALVTAQAGGFDVETRIEFKPVLDIVNVGATTPVGCVGQPLSARCVVRNAGHAWLPPAKVKFVFGPSNEVEKQLAEIAPGGSHTVSAQFVPTQQSDAETMSVDVRCEGESIHDSRTASYLVGSATELPAPRAALHSAANDRCAVLENERLRCTFRRHECGWGPGDIYAQKEGTWILVARIPRLSRLVTMDAQGKSHEHHHAASEPPTAELHNGEARLAFHWTTDDPDGGAWEILVGLTLGEHAKMLRADYELRCSQAGRLLAFDGLVLHALDRDEAVYPGLEWLVDDEVSSSTLDIAEGHADQLRFVVHPNMVTIPAIGVHGSWGTLGLLWDIHQKWDGIHERPSVLFASPDRFGDPQREVAYDADGSHVLGLFLPGVPEWVQPNQRQAETPYLTKPDQPLRLECQVLVDADATDALAPIDAWIDQHGFPDPAELPHGTYEREIEFSMLGYLQSLWIPDSRQWWTSKGGGIMSDTGRPPLYVADLLIGELLSPTQSVQQACRARATEVTSLIGGAPRIDAQRFGRRFDLALANPGAVAALLQSRNEDGMWAFDADRVGQGVFEGVDYRDLGAHEAVELGTTAANAYQVLRYARITGDQKAYALMLPTLERMTRFSVPRAAQVWEVPVHTPDILAASNALDAYLEAWRISGDRRWLDEAVRQARLGLPFVYLWDDPAQPYLVGASIPVFGATWFQGSWFGRPVQWNGLCYANSLLHLAQYDTSRDWRKLAEAIIRSAIHQQDQSGENVALWPDNISAINGEKCPWVFAPRQIIQNVLTLIGRDEEPATLMVSHADNRLPISSTARLSAAEWDGDSLTFNAAFSPGEQGCILIANVTRPASVSIGDREVPEQLDIEGGTDPGWRYDLANAFLTIRVPHSGDTFIKVAGAGYRAVERLPDVVRAVNFQFDDSLEGWAALHDVSEVRCDQAALVGDIVGADPYIFRSMLDVPADACQTIELRIRLTAGRGGQLFWTTKDSPTTDEAKAVFLPLVPDGQFHTLTVDVGKHPRWTGVITGLRIDPGGGVSAGQFAIDYVRGR